MIVKEGNRKGQLTLFVIVALVIVGAVVIYFAFRGSLFKEKIPANIEPAYTTFLTCLSEDTSVGIDLLESQAGYIEMPEFEPGSSYMPFSSHLNFAGSPVPYWYYVSGNNVEKEQVPTKREMQQQLEDFIEGRISDCLFTSYYELGYEIEKGEPSADVSISGSSVEVDLNMDLDITFGEDHSKISQHTVVVNSELGNLYDSALEVYEKEQDELFLEEYGIDILRLYAPVDGVELSCSPLTWEANEIFDTLEEAIEANTMALKNSGSGDDYFKVDVATSKDVRFIASRDWVTGFEVTPSEENILVANPVGNQPGMGILGFCYVPYHFIYNMNYPIMVQVYDGEEIFQFPLAIVIQGNNPREPLSGSSVTIEDPELCEYKNTLMDVKTYNSDLQEVEADISYECFGEKCNIGNSSSENYFPQCINGYILVSADGYADVKQMYSTVDEGTVSIFLDKVYDLNVDLRLDGSSYDGQAFVHFVSDTDSKSIAYPEQTSVELSEGQYEIQVYIYESSSLKIEESTWEQCVEVSQGGVGGLFGLTDQKCFEVTTPEQIVSNALSGGGSLDYYVLEEDLMGSNTIEINAESLPEPTSLDQLQDNYALFESKSLEVYFK